MAQDYHGIVAPADECGYAGETYMRLASVQALGVSALPTLSTSPGRISEISGPQRATVQGGGYSVGRSREITGLVASLNSIIGTLR